jgi:5-methylcytosine-specific restriction endonuclease McrBC regulatory subunit McrC
MNDEVQAPTQERSCCGANLKEYDLVPYCGYFGCDKYISASDVDSFLTGDKNGWRLGLYSSDAGLKLSHFSGAVWIREPGSDTCGVPLVVAPKIENLDSVQLWLDVATSPLYSEKLSESIFECDPDKPLIEGVALPDVSLLQIAVYLKELARFCQRDLRQGFLRTRENLVGRVKGRILIEENIRCNTVVGRADRVVCEYAQMTLDTDANRILKAALTRCYRYLSRTEGRYPQLTIWSRQCEAALSDVSNFTVCDADFRKIRYSGLMQRYRKPHKLAKMILKRLRTDAQGEILESPSVTVPFFINMWALFELYVGVILEKTGIQFIPQKPVPFPFKTDRGKSGSVTIKPDYYAEDAGIVADAKYKNISNEAPKAEEDSSLDSCGLNLFVTPGNADVYQVIAYSALLSAKEKEKPVKLALLICPGKPGNGDISQIGTIDDLIKMGAKCDLGKGSIPEHIFIVPCPVPERKTDMPPV